MSDICSTTCGVQADVIASYWDCVDVFRDCGWKHFVLIRCDWNPADLLDPAEWAAAVAANLVHLSPPGNFIPQAPTVTPFQIEGCGREVTGVAEYLFDFTTYQTDAALADYTYWKDLFANSASYHMIPVDCNRIFHISDDWAAAVTAGAPATVAGTTPGFEFSVTQVPYQAPGEGDYCVWTTQFKIRKAGVFCGRFLPGVFEVLA